MINFYFILAGVVITGILIIVWHLTAISLTLKSIRELITVGLKYGDEVPMNPGCSIFMADTMMDSRCIHCGRTREDHPVPPHPVSENLEYDPNK